MPSKRNNKDYNIFKRRLIMELTFRIFEILFCKKSNRIDVRILFLSKIKLLVMELKFYFVKDQNANNEVRRQNVREFKSYLFIVFVRGCNYLTCTTNTFIVTTPP